MPGSINPIEHPILFSFPKRLVPFAPGHLQIPIAMLLVDLVKPGVIVEVGTFLGESYCAFCQAIEELDLPTQAYGIGPVAGDPEWDSFGRHLWADLVSHHDGLYSGFSKLTGPDDPKRVFQAINHQVDLLHLVGRANKLPASLDLTACLSKISDRGVVWLDGFDLASTGVQESVRGLVQRFPHFHLGQPDLGQVIVMTGSNAPEAIRISSSDTASEDLGRFLAFLAESRSEELRARALTSKTLKQQSAILKLQLSVEGLVREKAALEAERVWLHQIVQQTQATRVFRIGQLYWRIHAWAQSRLSPGVTSEQLATSGAMPRVGEEEKSQVATKTERPLDSISSELHSLIAACEDRFNRTPSILDWSTGRNIASLVRAPVAFCSSQDPNLPYLDQSIDVVIHSKTDEEWDSEARRVARIAVVQVAGTSLSRPEHQAGQTGVLNRPYLSIDWVAPYLESRIPSISLILAVPQAAQLAEEQIRTLTATLPKDFSAEILVSADPDRAFLTSVPELDIKNLKADPGLAPGALFNMAVEAASGDLLVSIGGGMTLLPGWVGGLLRTIREHEGVGAVAAKIQSSSGTLVSAGAIVCADGSWLEIGKGDEAPKHPLYQFVREVDACSHRLWAMTRSAFESTGGFDRRYETVEYASTDFCFRAAHKGCRILYQPEFEATSTNVASTSAAEVTKESPEGRDRARFLERWAQRLRTQPPTPVESGRSAYYRLLPGRPLGKA